MSAAGPIHVLHVIKGLGRGGAETLLAHAQRYADRDRVRLSYAYYLAHKNALVAPLEELGARVTRIEARGTLGIALSGRRLARLLRDQAVDLVHAHLPVTAVAARLAGRRARVPVVYTEHNLHQRHHPLSRWANRATWTLQRHVVAVSRAVADSTPGGGRGAVPVTVVPNGVPVEELGRDPQAGRRFRDRLGISPEAPLVGQIAVFRPEKRLDLWLDAAAELARRVPGCRFVLAGDGPERRALEARAGELELAVHFPGLIGDVRGALSAFDLMMISSRFEGLPLVLLEAMASSTPVVATAVGGIPEAIEHERSGILVEARADRLAEAAAGLLGSPSRRRELARAAHEVVVERFSAESMQRRLERLYLEILER